MLYEKMNPGENLGWCKPLYNHESGVMLIVEKGNVLSVILQNEIITPVSDDMIEKLAKQLNKIHYLYKGWDYKHILLDSDFEELGCSDCPARFDCEQMQ